MMEDLKRTKHVQRVKVVMDGEQDLNGLARSIFGDCTHRGGIA
jgi:hypothetical protein